MTTSSARAVALLGGSAVLAAGLAVAPVASAAQVAAAGAGATTSAQAGAFKFKSFKTPSGNIQCGIVKSGGTWSIRCDVYEHDWTVPPKHCQEGDYGSSVSMGGKARPRFICVSDAIGARKVLAYGSKLAYGPFVCKSRFAGLKCWNKLDRGWFLSKESYSFFD